MKRPKNIPKDVLEYVEHLEAQLFSYRAETATAKLYLGVKKQLEDMGDLLIEGTVEVEIDVGDGEMVTETMPIMDTRTLSSGSDKFMDRFMKILDNCHKWRGNLTEMEESINPDIVEKVEKSKGSGLLMKALDGE